MLRFRNADSFQNAFHAVSSDAVEEAAYVDTTEKSVLPVEMKGGDVGALLEVIDIAVELILLGHLPFELVSKLNARFVRREDRLAVLPI